MISVDFRYVLRFTFVVYKQKRVTVNELHIKLFDKNASREHYLLVRNAFGYEKQILLNPQLFVTVLIPVLLQALHRCDITDS